MCPTRPDLHAFLPKAEWVGSRWQVFWLTPGSTAFPFRTHRNSGLWLIPFGAHSYGDSVSIGLTSLFIPVRETKAGTNVEFICWNEMRSYSHKGAG